MNKGELVDAIAGKAEVTKKDADILLTALLDTIMEAVAAGDKITLLGFGSFKPRQRAVQEVHKPQTLQIPTTTVPGFSAGKQFKERIVE